MQLVLQTQPQFLQRYFPYVKELLLGVWLPYPSPRSTRFQVKRHQPDVSKKAASLPKAALPSPVAETRSRAIPTTSPGKTASALTTDTKNDFFQHAASARTIPYQAEGLVSPKPAVFTIVANWVLGLLMLAAVVVMTAYFGPQLYYSIFPPQTSQPAVEAGQSNQQEEVTPLLALILEEQEKVQQIAEEAEPALKGRYLPELDPSLPEGDLIIIPRIGVNTALQRTEAAEEALETGVWWVPDFGLPGDLDKPMIVAGHRFGWRWWWNSDYWQYHSFYKLTELEPGDRIEIISEQRRWIYEVYASQEGAEITDYEADLILYTCKHLNSPIRYFKYASLVMDDV